MKKVWIILFSLILSGCETSNMQHLGSDGSITVASSCSFLTRSHTRIEKVASENADKVQFSPPYQIPNTSSNSSGFDGIFSSLISLSSKLTKTTAPTEKKETKRSIDLAARKTMPEAFVYDHDSDPEPAVRTIRISTVGVVTMGLTK